MATKRQRNVRDIFESSLESGEQLERRRRAEQQRAAQLTQSQREMLQGGSFAMETEGGRQLRQRVERRSPTTDPYQSTTGLEGIPGQLVDSLFRNRPHSGEGIGSLPGGAQDLTSIAQGAMRTTDEDSPHARGSQGGGGSQSYPDAGLDPRRNLAPEGLPSPGQQPGQGGMAAMLQQFQQQQQARQEQARQQLGSAYDRQIQAIRGQGPIMEGMAEEAQGNIGDFFGYAAESAEAGREPVQQAYGAAGEGVEQAYGEATEQVRSTPTVYADLAEQAGGAGARSGVAERVSAAAAPFEQALSSGEAAVQGNLAQGQAAGESYLSQLASAAPSEAAMAQSGVEGALQQQLQDLQMQAAQLEGAKQKAMMQVSADTSGDAFDRMMDLQQLQMAKEKHALDMQQGQQDLANPMGDMDLREQLQTQQLQQEMTDPTQQQPKRGFDMFLQQRFGDQPQTQQVVQQLGNYLTSNWPTETVRGEEEEVAPEQAVQQLMGQIQAPEEGAGEEDDPRFQLARELGLENPAMIGRANHPDVRRALEILAGIYQ